MLRIMINDMSSCFMTQLLHSFTSPKNARVVGAFLYKYSLHTLRLHQLSGERLLFLRGSFSNVYWTFFYNEASMYGHYFLSANSTQQVKRFISSFEGALRMTLFLFISFVPVKRPGKPLNPSWNKNDKTLSESIFPKTFKLILTIS